ncbi:MAG: STY0301 family protein [Thermodesulfovibrionales bacterium]
MKVCAEDRDGGGYWIRCSYRGTRAELSRRLRNSVSVCRVAYDNSSRFPSGLPVIRKIECR